MYLAIDIRFCVPVQLTPLITEVMQSAISTAASLCEVIVSSNSCSYQVTNKVIALLGLRIRSVCLARASQRPLNQHVWIS